MIHPFTALFASAALAYAVAFLLTRRIHISFWSFFGAFLYDWPKVLLLFGVQNIGSLLFFNYTVGIVIIPFFLVLLNFVFLQLNMFVKLKFLFRLIHRKRGPFNTIKIALAANNIIRSLQKYSILPKHDETRKVYMAGVIAGLVRLSVFLYCGL